MQRREKLARGAVLCKTLPERGQTVAHKRIPYFRFYPSDFMRGIRGLSAQEVGLYTMLLCRMYEESGPIEDHALRMSTYCGMRQATFEKTLQKLVDLGKIVRQDGMLWNDRAEVEISHRAHDLKVAIKAGKVSAEKRQQKQSKGAASVQRPFNHTDTDTDTVKTEPIGSAKKPRRRPEVDLPEGWVPSDKNVADAASRGFSEKDTSDEADKFRNYHHSKGSRFRDWDAAWRTWITNAAQFRENRRMAGGQKPGGYGQGSSIASIVARRRIEGKT